ncbi:hypothetical protein bthur0013_57990 [Bacillus thuringiensis IBL 200]|nr:hypothetical protein bthur0013_57990 [Bacillus thuringiensis IBL 200]
MTNVPWEWVPMEQVHELYTLRWQIEIVLKRGNHCLISIIVALSNEKE